MQFLCIAKLVTVNNVNSNDSRAAVHILIYKELHNYLLYVTIIKSITFLMILRC